METSRLSRAAPWLHLGLRLAELTFLGVELQRRTRPGRWRWARTAVALGLAVMDARALAVSAAPAPKRPRRAGRVAEDLGAGGPAESWRGSGLAEDVGANVPSWTPDEEDPQREEKMREAERQLGLPEL